MADPSVLIVGAGPTGLVLALWLTKQGVSVRIIDKTAEPGTTSRALAVHARTLELYEQLDLAEPVVAKGYTVPGARLWLGSREAARVPFEEIASDLTPYGFLHIFPQDEHERLLIARLQDLGVQVERSTELLGYTDEGDQISARLRGSDCAEKAVTAAFVAGCDGPRSKVREIMGTGFPGGSYPQIFYVADVVGEGLAINGDLNVDLDEADFLGIFPLAHEGRVRLIGAIKPEHGKDADKFTFDDISHRASHNLKLKVDKVNWFSVYHVHHRVTDRFRKGRAFVLGDAAHIHTPVGGQGMNTGIGDAINLAWKLEAVLSGRAQEALLDTYEAERRAFALRLVQTTDRFFNVAAAEGHLAEIIRTRVAPIVLPQMVRFEAARDYIFRTISQITLNYRGKGLDEGHAGPVHGGDRLPWVKMGGTDNYKALKRIGWQIHVYGKADDYVKRWAEGRRIPLEVYAWTEDMRHAGLRENALYLIRPDTYVALASPAPSVDAVEHYLAKVHINP
ncbi:MAG TPA: FAD-dependent oxidoreductase [Roseiarcus sp.]|jgi:2-polyprenyl-6-methoxyphenol hydroxylase-like FAD-dependent oxidoreductase